MGTPIGSTTPFRSGTGPEGLAGEVAGARDTMTQGRAQRSIRCVRGRRRSLARPGHPVIASGAQNVLKTAHLLWARLGVPVIVVPVDELAQRFGVIVRTAGQLLPADDTQSRAILSAQRGYGLGELDRLSNLTLQLEFMVVGEPEQVRVLVGAEGQAAEEIDGRQCLLVDLDLDRPLDLAQTAAAYLLDSRGQASADHEPAVCAGQLEAAFQSLGLAQLGSEIEGRPEDEVLTDRPDWIGQQPGDVEGQSLSRGRVLLRLTVGRIRRALPGRLRRPVRPGRPRRPGRLTRRRSSASRRAS